MAWSVRYALGAYVVTFVAVVLIGLVLRYGLHVHVHLGLGGLIVEALLLAALVPLARRRRMSFADLGLRPAPGARSVGLVLLALCAYAAIIAGWALAFVHHAPARRLTGVIHPSTLNAALDVLAMSTTAPIVEEVFFRGLLYRSLRNRLPVLPAALIAAALFGLVHILGYPLISLPVKAAFGLIACLLYERTGSLLPGIALHSFVDASAIDLALTGNDRIVLEAFALGAVIVVVVSRVEGLLRSDRARARQRE